MDRSEVRRRLVATGEEITDSEGTVIGYVAQAARFRLDKSHIAGGGFLAVVRDEESGDFVGTEFDALPHPKTGNPYPAGHSGHAWRVTTLVEAIERVMAYQITPGVQ